MQSIDLAILHFFNQTLASPTGDALSEWLTNVHYWFAVYAVCGLYLIYRYKWRGVRMVMAAVLVVSLADSVGHYLVKPMVDRQRPCALLPGGAHVVAWIRLPTGMKWDESFPSNHALNNFAVATFFALVFRRRSITIPLIVFASLVSIGRVYEGVHYPSDVLGGAAIGALIGFFIASLFRFLEARLAARRLKSSSSN